MSYRYLGYVRNHMADDLPRLPTYNEALLWFSAVKPFAKGRSVGEKPLGRNRRYDRFIITKNLEDAIRIIHYKTCILQYNPDGSLEVSTGGYDSISTVQALQELLGPERFLRQRCKAYYQDGNGHFFRFNDKLTIASDGRADTTNLKPEYTHLISRGGFKEAKAIYATFMDYAKQINTLTQGGSAWTSDLGIEADSIYYARMRQLPSIDASRMHWYKTEQLTARVKFFEKIRLAMLEPNETDRMAAMYPLVQVLSFSASNSINFTSTQGDDRFVEWETDNKRLEHYFNTLLKFHHADLVFAKTEVPLGTIRHDNNAKFIKLATPATI